MAIDAAAAAGEIESALRAVGTPERAEGEKAYLKTDLTFFGTTVWQIRAAVKDVSRGKALDHDALVALAEALWSEPVHERRMAAVMLLDLHPRLLSAADLPLVGAPDPRVADLVGKRPPAEVAQWLTPRMHRASGVTMREAVRYLAPEDNQRLMAAYREHRPAA